jgi:hypothetical protein
MRARNDEIKLSLREEWRPPSDPTSTPYRRMKEDPTLTSLVPERVN